MEAPREHITTESDIETYEEIVSLEKSRNILRAVSLIDLIFTLIILMLWLFDTSPSYLFSMMMLFQIPHAFAWNTSLAVSCKMEFIPYVISHILLYVICFVADAASVIWRGYILATCVNCSAIAVGFGWATLACVLVLLGLDFMSIMMSIFIKDGLSHHFYEPKKGPHID